jgi:hypothetical protein
MIKQKFHQAERARRPKSDQWIKNLAAVRGEDTRQSLRPETEVADIYVRTTTTKTKAAYAQINEALLSGDKFPISVMPTQVPDGIAEFAHLKQDAAPEEQAPPSSGLDVGFDGDGMDIPAGATQETIGTIIGSSYSKGLEEEMFEEGNDATGTGAQISPAKNAALKMEKMIHDQLGESKARMGLRRALYELCMLGTGAMKGPFTSTKKVNEWVDGKYTPKIKEFPAVSFVSLWDLYVDPNAYNSEDIEWIIERHRLNFNQLSELGTQPLFNKAAIDELVLQGGNYTHESHEHAIRDSIETETEGDLFEVLEFWGYISTQDAVANYGLEVPEGAGHTVQVNVWTSGGKIIRLTINPFLPARIPYFLFPYEEDPYSIYGTGIPELMEDLQYLMNGMTRLAVENAMLAGNVMLDVDKQALANEQDMKVYPGKIWERQMGATGNAVNAIEIPFVAHQNMQMFSQFRQMADEATGIQSILHGQTGVAGTGRTASGLSMLMDSASMSIKNVIRNIDDHLLKPLASSYFQWNMQFNTEEHPEIKGDLEIRALGSFNLISKERKAQSLQTFLQLSTNPQLAPLIRLPTIVKDLAVQMDMDPNEVLNSPEEAMVYAQLMAMNQAAQGGGPQGGVSGSLPAAPGEQGFTGNNEGAGNPTGVTGEQPVQ